MKNHRQGKKGKFNTMAGIFWLLAVIALVVIGTVAYPLLKGEKTLSTGNKEESKIPSTGCDEAPSLSANAKNSFAQSTAVSTGKQYFYDGQYFSSSPSVAAGKNIAVLYNASSYIDVVSEDTKIACGANNINVLIKPYQAATIEIKEDSTVLTDNAAGGAHNATGISSGGSNTVDVYFTGHDKKSTGKSVFVVEFATSANISSVSMYDSNGNDLETIDVPGFYVDTLTSPYKKAFVIPEIDGAKEVKYSLTVVAKSGKTGVGAMYTTMYAGQAFADTDGKLIDWGVEDSDDSTKYEATYDYDVKFKA